MPPQKPIRWQDLMKPGPTVKALCFGINKYDHLGALDNCEADADAMAERVSRLPGNCTARVCKGGQLKDKAAMRAEIVKFVQGIDKDAPPRVVLVSYSGHAVQHGESILMVPGGAPKEPEALKQACFSHDELFEILYQEMHKKTSVSRCCPRRGLPG